VTLIGIVVVFLAVIGGYAAEGGNLALLWQPIELVIIGGAAAGAFLISNPMSLVKSTFAAAKGTLSGAHHTNYDELFVCIYQLLTLIRKEGSVAVEPHIDQPSQSTIFQAAPSLLKSKNLVDFICDNLKAFNSTSMAPHEFEQLMDTDIASQKEEMIEPAHAITRLADGLPGLGIVAAVLGVVLTMTKISEPAEVIGHSIGAALVGTFLGILGSYGFASPVATQIESRAHHATMDMYVCKAALISFAMGWPPMLALEHARRVIPPHERPDFSSLEKILRAAKK
jgi:chemotaxis protein MotA